MTRHSPQTASQDPSDLDSRSQSLLRMLVERYIESGEPIASKWLASVPGVKVSSATVRNVMASLEQRGLVRSPHTSAGKVPTNEGLRFFVDSLVQVPPIDTGELSALQQTIDPDASAEDLISQASVLLSTATDLVGVVTMKGEERGILRQMEFLKLSGTRALVIMVVNDRDVRNHIIHTTREYSERELDEAGNFVSKHFGGMTLKEIRDEVLASMESDKEKLDSFLQTTLEVAGKAIQSLASTSDNLALAGEAHLLGAHQDLESAKKALDAFARKRLVLELLDRSMRSDGIQLYIGGESGYKPFSDFSVVTRRYRKSGEIAGVLGVIGPKRMPYQKVIGVVDMTSKLLERSLE
ncbi:MAG: heat-inducible transcriptional repressor HrcA [Gammaproteobacteria bacterium]|nr:heat-inducible transcriptional repressor HrcA [Gammaproteobacteria bacterium]